LYGFLDASFCNKEKEETFKCWLFENLKLIPFCLLNLVEGTIRKFKYLLSTSQEGENCERKWKLNSEQKFSWWRHTKFWNIKIRKNRPFANNKYNKSRKHNSPIIPGKENFSLSVSEYPLGLYRKTLGGYIWTLSYSFLTTRFNFSSVLF